MSTEERNIWINLVGEVLVNLYFAQKVWQMFGAGLPNTPEAVQTWARAVIWIIPVGIGAGILLSILGRIFAGIFGQDSALHMDERDRAIQIKAMAVTMVFAALAFITALSLLAYGTSALVGLNVIFFGFGLATIAGDIAKLLMYRV